MFLFAFDFINVKPLDIVDILLVSVLLYQLYRLIKGTAAMKIFVGIIAVFFVWKIVNTLQMELLSALIGQFISVGVIALIVVFQPEIRKFLLLLGNPDFYKKRKFLLWHYFNEENTNISLETIVDACQKMANEKTGALIVMAHKSELEEYITTGEIVDARIGRELIQNIFFKNSPLHDGAMVIQNNRIKAARCILPISTNNTLPSDLGLRHRSALGLTENSDAIAIVVSEQTGNISFCKEGVLYLNIQPAKLLEFLLIEFDQTKIKK
ncbi:MAG: diadenylate cyclase CdaA [Bacteroidota bacterium]